MPRGHAKHRKPAPDGPAGFYKKSSPIFAVSTPLDLLKADVRVYYAFLQKTINIY